MNRSIEVYIDMPDCSAAINRSLEGYDRLAKKLTAIASCLAESDKWSGDRRDKAAEIHRLVQQYAGTLQPIIEDLMQELDKMIYAADTFADNSRNVGSVKGW